MTAPGRLAPPLGVTLPVEDELSAPDHLRLAVAAQECGYHSVWAGEVAGPEVFALLGMIVARTRTIRVGSGIASVYPRSAPLAAMGFATLASAAPGRVLAGLGASSPLIVRDWHGREFDRPLATVERYVATLRAAWAGERVDLPPVRGFRLRRPLPEPPPIVLAAMNPGMLRLAGRVADGVFLTWCPPDEVAARLAHVRQGERAAGRAPGSVWAMASFWAYAGDRTDEAGARLRRAVLQYAMVPTHRAAFTATFPAVERAARHWSAGERATALALVPEELVHRQCALGDGATVARRAADLIAAGIALPVALTTGAETGDLDGPLATIHRTAAARAAP